MSQENTSELFFSAPQLPPSVENTKNVTVNDSTAQEAALFFGVEPTKNVRPPSPQRQTATQSIFAKLAEDPTLLNIPAFSQVTTKNIHRPQSSRRDVPLYYVTEIAQFTDKQVEEGLKTKIDPVSGELYGPHPEYPFGSTFSSRDELAKIHSNTTETCSYPVGGPATSVLLLDISPNDDRGNIVLFVGEKVVTEPNQVPPLIGANQALYTSLQQKTAFRVIRGHEDPDTQVSTYIPVRTGMYRYDGMYFVGDYWYEQLDTNLYQYVFKLVRLYGQPQLAAVTELYKTIFPPTSKIVNDERYGINPNMGTFFPSVVTPQPMSSPLFRGVNRDINNAIHSVLLRHSEEQKALRQKEALRQQQEQALRQQQSMFQAPQLTPVFQQPNLQPVYQQQQQPVFQQPNLQPYGQFEQRKAPQFIRGMDLSQGPVREMLTQLRRKNEGSETRIKELQEEIEQVESKSKKKDKVKKVPRLTSRNPDFHWADEEPPRKRKK